MNIIKEIKRRGGIIEIVRSAYTKLIRNDPNGIYQATLKFFRIHPSYQSWIKKFDSDNIDYGEIKTSIEEIKEKSIKIGIIQIVNDSNIKDLYISSRTIFNQIWKDWEIVCIFQGVDNFNLSKLNDLAKSDDRVKIVVAPSAMLRSECLNLALTVMKCQWLVVLDLGDMLRPHSLVEIAIEIKKYPMARVIYTDEDEINSITFKRFNPKFKPDWSPDLLRSYNYLGCFVVLKLQDVLDIGGWNSEFNDAESYDLYLRISEKLIRKDLHHIPKVLCHRNFNNVISDSRLSATRRAAARQALSDHLIRSGRSGTVMPIADHGLFRIRYDLPVKVPRVDILIPNKNMSKTLEICIDSIYDKTTYENYQVIVIDNKSEDERLHDIYRKLISRGGRVIEFPHEFNFSAMNNMAVRYTDGDIVVFLNNDTEVISADWLQILVSHALQANVGCVGAKLYYDDNTVQHAGVFVGVGGVASHPYRGASSFERGYCDRLQVTQNFCAVTAACLAIQRSVFVEVGGFDEKNFKISLNDVDLCLRVREAGYDNVWTPHAELYHHESRSRGYVISADKRAEFQAEAELFASRWPSYLTRDPYHSPNLDKYSEFVAIRSV